MRSRDIFSIRLRIREFWWIGEMPDLGISSITGSSGDYRFGLRWDRATSIAGDLC